MERMEDGMETDLKLFSQAFNVDLFLKFSQTFDLTSATISKWHLFTHIYKTFVQSFQMLIYKPFTLLAAAVMDRPMLNFFGGFCSDTTF